MAVTQIKPCAEESKAQSILRGGQVREADRKLIRPGERTNSGFFRELWGEISKRPSKPGKINVNYTTWDCTEPKNAMPVGFCHQIETSSMNFNIPASSRFGVQSVGNEAAELTA